MHTNPVKGLGAETIAKKFRANKGWFIAIVSLPPYHYGLPPTLEGHIKAIEILIRECTRARKIGLKVACIAGFHPAEFDHLVKKHRLELKHVIELAKNVIDVIAKFIRSGELNGIGEVGRPHYKVEPEYVVASEIITDYALERAKDLDAAVHLHLEEGGYVTVLDIKNRIARLKLNPIRVVIHHARPRNLVSAIELGLMSSVPGIRPIHDYIIKSKIPPMYTFESDYLDDPSRPGSVIYPWELIQVQKEYLEKGLYNEEYLWKINIDNIVLVYGVEPP